jgi:hypothetical protein
VDVERALIKNLYVCDMLTTPTQIAPFIKDKTIENIFFKKFLRNFSAREMDAKIHVLADEVSPQIDFLPST